MASLLGNGLINVLRYIIKFLDENTFFLKIFCHKFENIFVIKCKKIEIKKVKLLILNI